MKTIQIVGDSAYGGATYLILEWCKFLLRQGCEVHALSTNMKVIDAFAEIPNLQIIQDIMIPRDINLRADAAAFFKLLRLFRAKQYDIVHTYTATPGFLGRTAARLVNIPVILHHQAGWTVAEYTSLSSRLLYTSLEYVAALASTHSICVSHAVANQALQFRTAPKRRLVTICNGIDPQPFVDAAISNSGRHHFRMELGIPENYLLVGSTGRLAKGKDNDSLIRALLLLDQILDGQPFILLIAGDGPQRAELEMLVAKLNLGNRVQFLGFLRDVPRFLAALDIFVTPSLREGLSIALLEAMATARPIIATSILPNAELIEHEHTGLLVEPGSAEQIAVAIARFAHDSNLAQRCATQAQQRVLADYTLDRMFEETWALYKQLLGKIPVK